MTTSDSPQLHASLAIEDMSLSEEANSSNNDIQIQQIKLEYKSCVETEEMSPRAFATERMRGILLDLSELDSQQKKQMEVEMIEATVQPCDMVLNPSVAVADKETTFRNTEAQLLLRLQFWARLGDSFVRHYRKLKLSRKKKRGHHNKKSKKNDACHNLLLSDICDLFSMLAMKLPQSRPFSTFLSESLDPSLYDGASKLPKDLFTKLYLHFEILDPSAKAEEYFDFATAKPRRPKRRESSSTVSTAASLEKSSQSTGTNASEKQKNKPSQSKPKPVAPSINLLAPAKKRNSLLGDGATQFVGSHFNTTLTNMSSLFREVSGGNKQQTRVAKTQKPGPPRSQQQQRGKLAVSAPSGPDQILVAAGKRKSAQCFQVPVKKSKPAQARVTSTRVDETPVPSRKKSKCFQVPQAHGALAVQRSKPAEARVRVDETPVPHRQRPSAMLVDLHAARKVVVQARSALRRQK